MASGFAVAGTDFDSIFNPRVTAKRADVGYKVGGVDISNRYETSIGGDQRASPTGYKVSGADLQTLFQKLGYVPLSCGLDTASATGSGVGTGPFSTNNVTATGAGGIAGYTYLWTYVSGDATVTVSNSTAATVNFTASGIVGTPKNSVWKCTVTDSASHTAASTNVSIGISFNASAMTASASPGSVSGTGSSGGSFTVTSNASSATPSGGTGPYTYLWQKVSGDAGTAADTGTAASTTFSRLSTSPDTESSIWRCRVTDNLSNQAFTNNVNVDLYFT